MKKQITYLLLCCLYGCITTVRAQYPRLTEQDSIFFESKLPNFKKWLHYQGFDTLLKIHELDPDPIQLNVILVSNYLDRKQTEAEWDALKAQYDSTHSDDLETRLFKYTSFLMEVPAEQLVIEIYHSVKEGTNPCFYKAIYFDKGEFHKDSKQCQDGKVQRTVHIGELRPELLAVDTLKKLPVKLQKRSKLQAAVMHVLKKHYKNGKTKLTPKEALGSLVRIEVSNLRREVLPEAANSILGRFLNSLGLDVDWAKRELIIIDVKYEISEEDEYIFTLNVDGKYGSGVHHTRRDNYIEMETEFEVYEQQYAEILINELMSYLKQKH